MTYSATIARSRGLINEFEYERILNLFSRAGLAMDDVAFDEKTLVKSTDEILKTRNGKLRAVIPSPIGSCVFLNDISIGELSMALTKHKKTIRDYPRRGEGLDPYIDTDDV